MSSQIQQFGTQIELDFRDLADSPPISPDAAVATGANASPPPPGEQSPRTLTIHLPADCSPASSEAPLAISTSADDPRGKKQSPSAFDGGKRMVSDLLAALARLESPLAGLATMRSAVGHACEYLGLAPEQCPVQQLRHINEGFKAFLRERRYSRNTARTYRTHVRMFLEVVDDLGWGTAAGGDSDSRVEEGWREVAAKISSTTYKTCMPVIRYAVGQGRLPKEFGDSELTAWSNRLLGQGRTPQYVRHTVREFRKAVENLQLTAQMPRVSLAPPRFTYGVRFEHLPSALRNEIQELLVWKQATFAPGRSKKGKHRGRHRPVTAESLKGFLCRLYGFVVNAPHKTRDAGDQPRSEVLDESCKPTTLVELVTPTIIREYSEWFLNHRRKKSSSLAAFLVMLPGLFRHPRYSGKDFSWLQDAINDLPPDPKSAIQEAKQRKWVEFPRLMQIPQKIRALRLAMANAAPKKLALMVRDELLMLWLTHLPWRQKNIRNCKIAPQEHGGNLFKETLPDSATMDIPEWVTEALKANPNETFWQIYFREEEIKIGSMVVRMVVPRALIPLLEDYLQHHRPVLLKGRLDPGTLFLTADGEPLTQQQVTALVAKLTHRHTGRRVTPHLFRDIFAMYCLKGHPDEVVVVSKVLWHKSIQTTIDRYAWAFDSSHAQARIEECLEKESQDLAREI